MNRLAGVTHSEGRPGARTPWQGAATASHTSLAQLAAQVLDHWAMPHRHTGAAGLTSRKRTRRLCITCDASNRLTASYLSEALQILHEVTSRL